MKNVDSRVNGLGRRIDVRIDSFDEWSLAAVLLELIAASRRRNK